MHKLIGVGLAMGVLAVSSAASSASERLEDGKRAYTAACAKCHDSGINGAPVTGKTGSWTDRSHLWEAVLFEHANKGYLKMPAKGGNEGMSEYEVDAAAEYMLTVSHPEFPAD